MASPRRYFWSHWPEASQRRFFKLMLMGAVFGTAAILAGIKIVGGQVEQQIAQGKEQYARVLPLVEDIAALRAQRGNLAHLPLKDAVWEIIDDLLIEENLTSLRTTRINEDLIGMQATFTGLSQSKLAEFLRALRERASLQTPDCALTRNPDDPRLADAHFVLAR